MKVEFERSVFFISNRGPQAGALVHREHRPAIDLPIGCLKLLRGCSIAANGLFVIRIFALAACASAAAAMGFFLRALDTTDSVYSAVRSHPV